MDYYRLLIFDHYSHNKVGPAVDNFDGFITNNKIKQQVIGGKPVKNKKN